MAHGPSLLTVKTNILYNMARTIQEIYNQIVEEKNKRLELNEFNSDSKVSILNGFFWIISAAIYTFETILDTYTVDISNVIKDRINGTPSYYVNALLKYQHGDELKVREDGLGFGYDMVDETKRIITQASYQEETNQDSLDTKLILKVATGEKGSLQALTEEQLLMATAYIKQIKFAGTNIEVVSQKGDVLIPRLTVYHDGALSEEEMRTNIDNALYDFIMETKFDSAIYTSSILQRIMEINHVKDVYIDSDAEPRQGIYLVSYKSDGSYTEPTLIGRMAHTSSGFLRESSKEGDESSIPNFRESIILRIDA